MTFSSHAFSRANARPAKTDPAKRSHPDALNIGWRRADSLGVHVNNLLIADRSSGAKAVPGSCESAFDEMPALGGSGVTSGMGQKPTSQVRPPMSVLQPQPDITRAFLDVRDVPGATVSNRSDAVCIIACAVALEPGRTV